MAASERGRGRRDDTDTIIARMEAQFQEDKGPVVDTNEEARRLWPYEGVYLMHRAHDPLIYGFEGQVEAVGPSGPRAWIVHSKGSAKSERRGAAEIERWFATRARERNQGSEPEGVSNLKKQFVRDWASKVDAGIRERFVMDLEYALKRLGLVFAGDQGLIWLESFNYDLNGRPIDILRERGPAEVITALDGEEQGAL